MLNYINTKLNVQYCICYFGTRLWTGLLQGNTTLKMENQDLLPKDSYKHIDLLDQYHKEGEEKVKDVLKILSKAQCSEPCSDKAALIHIRRCIEKDRKFRRRNSQISKKQHKEWLDAPVQFKIQNKDEQSNVLHTPKAKDPVLCCCPSAEVSAKIAIEHKLLEANYQESQKALHDTNEEISTLKKSRVLPSHLKKLEGDTEKMREENIILTRTNSDLVNKVIQKNNQLKALRVENKRSQVKVETLRNKNDILVNQLSATEEKCEEIKTENDNLKRTSHEQQNEIDELRSIIDDTEIDDIINCYDYKSRQYTTETRECVYNLLSLNVPARNVSATIQCVLKLAKKRATRLPQKSTILDMNIERLTLAQHQLSEELPNKEHTTLYTDETTKFGEKFAGYHASDKEDNMFVLGLRNISTKSADDTLTGLKQILDDINEKSSQQNDITKKRILYNITSTMSDRAATEIKFNKMVEDLRKEVLPELRPHFTQLSNAEQESCGRLLKFGCGLHGLVHHAEAATKSLSAFEKVVFGPEKPPILDMKFYKPTESGTFRLIRTTSNALGRGGDEKNGCYGEFKLYIQQFLRANGIFSLPIEPYHGNRFNILFENSVAFFFLHEKIAEFLAMNNNNNLLKSVLHDIGTPHYVAGTKALGLVCRFITSPLWKLLENRDIHIFQMNTFYNELVAGIDTACNNIESFMKGEIRLFVGHTTVKADAMLIKLLEPYEHDDKVEMILQVLLPALAAVSRHLYKDHLPGGKFEVITDEMKIKAQSAQKTNKFAESVFGFLDNLLRKSPNISTVASEACIMFVHNKTLDWLLGKEEDEKKEIIKKAISDKYRLKVLYKQREEEVRRRRLEAQERSRRQKEDAEKRKKETLESYTNAIMLYGFWQTEKQVDEMVEPLKTAKEKKSALKAQLNYRKHLLHQDKNVPGYENVFAFSKKIGNRTVLLNVAELCEKVKALIRFTK